jgi:hypothetical protein
MQLKALKQLLKMGKEVCEMSKGEVAGSEGMRDKDKTLDSRKREGTRVEGERK